jgi:preprotein translocase subunit SecG
MKNTQNQGGSGAKESQLVSLQRTVKQLRIATAVLAVAFAASMIYIVATPSTPDAAREIPVQMQAQDAAPSPQPAPMQENMQPQMQPGVTQQPTPTSTTPTATPVTPAPVPATATPSGGSQKAGNLNPPHGQPGHSCAIPVGSPLN